MQKNKNKQATTATKIFRENPLYLTILLNIMRWEKINNNNKKKQEQKKTTKERELRGNENFNIYFKEKYIQWVVHENSLLMM